MIDARQLANFGLEDFQEGQLLLVNKPLNWTSFDVVSKLRWLIRKRFGIKKIKVGHAGTLDPLATGLLIVCTGKFTKRIAELTLADKTYTGTFTIGATRPSHDLETEIAAHYDWSDIRSPQIEEAISELSGTYMQKPPQFSAKLVDGKRAYLSARKGREVEIPSREVHVYQFDVDCSRMPEVPFKIRCSKGTYIRAIARDLGKKLRCGAFLSALHRSHIGHFDVAHALSIVDIEAALSRTEE